MILRTLILLFAVVALSGCAKSIKPIDPNSIAGPDEMKPGRGLSSGDDGEFTLKF